MTWKCPTGATFQENRFRINGEINQTMRSRLLCHRLVYTWAKKKYMFVSDCCHRFVLTSG